MLVRGVLEHCVAESQFMIKQLNKEAVHRARVVVVGEGVPPSTPAAGRASSKNQEGS